MKFNLIEQILQNFEKIKETFANFNEIFKFLILC